MSLFVKKKKDDYEKIIAELDEECCELRREKEITESINDSLLKILNDVKSNYEVLNIIVTNTIDNEEGKETNFTKFNSILDFANYIRNTNNASINSINTKLNSIKIVID